MCGFLGFSFNDDNLLRILGDTLKDRAVDAEYFYTEENLSFYHAHLAISDLDKNTSQPLVYKNLVIGLVGEIYNKQHLLEISGINKHENNFTELEVIGIAYNKLGETFINYVNGEFAIFIFDKTKKEYLLFRDRYGTNLIYYRLHNGELFFSSEIKGLIIDKPIISKKGLYDYMIFQYVISPNTIIHGINSLIPGTYLKFKKGTGIKIYHFKPYIPQEKNLSLLKSIEKAVIRRLPKFQNKIFLSLSGGPDSNLILYFLNKHFKGEIISYSLLTKNNKKEIKYAINNCNTLGLKHLILDIDKESLKGDFFSTSFVHEGLVQMPNILKLVKDNYPKFSNIKVSFAGDGKEELLLFNKHYPYRDIIARYEFFKKKHKVKYNINHRFLNYTLFDFNLQLYDKISLRNGVEIRLPFTDYELIKFSGYSFNLYRKEVTKFLNKKGINIVKDEYGFAAGMKFSYFYDKELIIRSKKLLKDFNLLYKKILNYD